MKPLQNMNNIEKGRLFLGLFPERLPEMLRSVQDGYKDLTLNEQALRPLWDGSLFRFDLWYSLAASAADTAARFGSTTGTQQLTEKLFAGHTAAYTIDCISRQAHALPDLAENTAYKAAVKMLFGCYTAIPCQKDSTDVEPKN
ncbi:hypothetical protein [Flavobacterium sp. fv08]|uniref:hypothetical protein n=1 Tax=Flavobacterium sp. fv08 TaxID=1761784 RepID=UPI00115FA715|nr:hypothetical protein [Flavobacterium sp. fv08]